MRRLLLLVLLPLAALTTPPSFLCVELNLTDIRNKFWYLHITLGHRTSCTDALLPWSPITHFLGI